jgi:hypothetical protein
MGTTIATNALSSGYGVKLALLLGGLAVVAVGLAPSDVPVIGDLIGDAHAGTNDDSI